MERLAPTFASHRKLLTAGALSSEALSWSWDCAGVGS